MPREPFGATHMLTEQQKIDMRTAWFSYRADQRAAGNESLRLLDFVNGYKAACEFHKKTSSQPDFS